MTIPAAIYLRVGDEIPASPETNQILVYFDDIGGMFLEFNGQTAEVFTSASIPYGTSAEDVGSAGAAGTAESASRSDHVHRGVFTVKKEGGTDIFGTITLSEGGGILLTQVGNDIEIQSTTTSTFIGLTDTPSAFTLANVIYTSNGTPNAVIESGAQLTVGTNAFTLTRGTTDLYVTTDCDIDQNLSTISVVEFAGAVIGDASNYTQFDTDGSQTMVGTARKVKLESWSVHEMDGITGTWAGIAIDAGAGSITYGGVWTFFELNENDNRAFSANWHVPEEYEAGTDIVIEIEWAAKGTDTGDAVMYAGFVEAVVGSVFPLTGGTFSSSTITGPGVAYQYGHKQFTVSGTGLSGGDFVKLIVFRNGDAVADTLTDRVEVTTMCVRYTINKLGA